MDSLILKKAITICSVILVSFLISLGAEALLSIPKEANIISGKWQVLSPEKTVSKQISNTFVIDINNTPKFSEGLYVIDSRFRVIQNIDRAYLVMTQQPDHGFRIWIDNKFIAEVGDINYGQSNIWRGSGFFPIPNGISLGYHDIKIEIYAVEELALLTSPYIVDIHWHPLKFIGIEILNNYFVIFITGITFALGVLFISLGFVDWKNEKIKALLGLAFILMAIYFLDFLSIQLLLVKYLTFKKVVLTCMSFGFLLTFTVIVSELDGHFIKKNRLIFLVIVSVFTLVTLFVPQRIELFKVSQLIITLLGLFLFALIVMHPKLYFWKKEKLNFIVLGILSLSFFTIRYIYYTLIKVPYTDLVHVGVFIYIISIFLYFIVDYINKSKKVVLETLRANHYFNKSVIDPLTNVNNRNILSYINLKDSQFILYICDLDDFKNINDNYGHNAGDEVLIRFSYLIKRFIRDSDYIIRLGGDEFCIILTGCSGSRGQQIGSQIWEAIAHESINVGENVVTFSTSGGGVESKPGEDFDSALKRADGNLYDIKNTMKGSIKFL